MMLAWLVCLASLTCINALGHCKDYNNCDENLPEGTLLCQQNHKCYDADELQPSACILYGKHCEDICQPENMCFVAARQSSKEKKAKKEPPSWKSSPEIRAQHDLYIQFWNLKEKPFESPESLGIFVTESAEEPEPQMPMEELEGGNGILEGVDSGVGGSEDEIADPRAEDIEVVKEQLSGMSLVKQVKQDIAEKKIEPEQGKMRLRAVVQVLSAMNALRDKHVEVLKTEAVQAEEKKKEPSQVQKMMKLWKDREETARKENEKLRPLKERLGLGAKFDRLDKGERKHRTAVIGLNRYVAAGGMAIVSMGAYMLKRRRDGVTQQRREINAAGGGSGAVELVERGVI